jgi:hypothetical protein
MLHAERPLSGTMLAPEWRAKTATLEGLIPQALPNSSPLPRIAIVLGAGASRDVSYAGRVDISSPLDADFFDLLQRVKARTEDRGAKEAVLNSVRRLPYECWRSFERAFYTLHLRALISAKLDDEPYDNSAVTAIVEKFTRCLEAVLREAHGTRECQNHNRLFAGLREADTKFGGRLGGNADRASTPHSISIAEVPGQHQYHRVCILDCRARLFERETLAWR